MYRITLLLIIVHAITDYIVAVDDDDITQYTDDTCVLTDIQHPDIIFYKHICGNETKAVAIFKNSKIWHVPKIFDVYPALRSLDMTNCSVEYIDTGTFGNATKLKSLFMSNNNISNIGNYAFKGANSLFNLLLSTSNISTIESKTFFGLTNLIKLDMGFNNIELLPAGVFDPLLRVESIRLNDNNIKSIGQNLFDKNEKLKRLYLSDNHIASFDPESLMNTNLMSIDLANNPLGHVDFSSLEHLQSLTLTNTSLDTLYIPPNATDISAANNLINTIEMARTFDGSNVRVQRLNLSNNFVVNMRNLSKIISVTVLDLSYNDLSTIDFAVLEPLKQLKQLSLFGNPFATFNASALQQYLPNLNIIELSPYNWTNEYKKALADKLHSEDIYMIFDERPAEPVTHPTAIPSAPTAPTADKNARLSKLAETIQQNFTDFQVQFRRVLKEIEYLGRSVNTTMQPYDLLTKMSSDLVRTQEKLLTMLIETKEANVGETVEANVKVIMVLMVICVVVACLFGCWKLMAVISASRLSWPWYRRQQAAQSSETLHAIYHSGDEEL